MGLLKKPHLPAFAGSGKGAFHITEQFALQKVFRKGGTVNGHKRPIFPAAAVMYALGKQFLAGPCFPHNDHIGIRCSIPPGRLYGLVNDPALVDDILKRIFCLESPLAELAAYLAFQVLDHCDVGQEEHHP